MRLLPWCTLSWCNPAVCILSWGLRSCARARAFQVLTRARIALVARESRLDGITRVRGRPELLRPSQSWLRQLELAGAETEEVAELPAAAAAAAAAASTGAAAAAGAAAGAAAPPWQGVLDHADRQSTAYLVEAGVEMPASLKVIASADGAAGARCVLIAKPRACEAGPSGHGRDKTMLLFSLAQEKVGGLAEMLAVFHSHGVNLIGIQSYQMDDASRATFFVEVAGHEADPTLSVAIAVLREQAADLVVLGSFATQIARGLGAS